MTSVDLTTRYLGLKLSCPLVASSSPLTGRADGLAALQEAGAGAVVLPSVFEEQVEHDMMALHDGLEYGSEHQSEAFGGYFPELDDYNTGPDRYLDQLRRARRELSIPVIASLNGSTPGGWTYYAGQLEDAGADALELNLYMVAADPLTSPVEVEDRYLTIVEEVRAAVALPLAVKIGPYFSALANMGRRIVDAGADGLVLFNRFYQPDLDLGSLDVVPHLELSTSAELRPVLRWMAILSAQLECSLAGTSGVHTVEDAVKLILAGADVVMMASALLAHGAPHLGVIRAGVEEWFGERRYPSTDVARGSLSQAGAPDPAAYERVNYMRALTDFSSRF